MNLGLKITDIYNNLKLSLGANAKICIALSTSNEGLNIDPFFGGCRIFNDLAIISIVNLGQHALLDLIPLFIDLNLHLILADTDKKHPFDTSGSSIYLSNLVSELQQSEFVNVIPFSSTKLTVDAVINSLVYAYGFNLSGLKVSIVGLGAIGFQLALELVRQGVTVNISSKNHSKGRDAVNCINFLKSNYTLATANYFNNIKTSLSASNILIDCSSATDLYDETYIPYLSRLSKVISVSKTSFSVNLISKIEPKVDIIRTDVSPELISLVISDTPNIRESYQPSAKHYGNHRLICNGYKGIPGDIVVNSTETPVFVLGVVNRFLKLDPIYMSFDAWCKL